jgi:phosphate:Na+ symporter
MTNLVKIELREIAALRHETIKMLESVQTMFQTSFDGLMKNDINILDQVLKDQTRLNEIYSNQTTIAVEISREDLTEEAKAIVTDLVKIIGAIEKMGGLCVCLVERIEYKITERLLFSETAVQEYKELCDNIDNILSNSIVAIRTSDEKLGKKILESGSRLYALIKKSRTNHIDRLAKGVCDEWAKIRYLDMLDYVEEIAGHCIDTVSKLVKKYPKS